MIKEYFILSPILDSYGPIGIDTHQKESGWLCMLYDSFFTFNNAYIWVQEDEEDSNVITISMHFLGDNEDEFYPDAILKISRKNYEYMTKKFEKINKEQPKYFILSYDDNGWIDLESKNELSQEDWQYIDQDKHKKLSKKYYDE